MEQFKDGIYDISNALYHAANGISRTKLMLLNKSPYHFWYETLSGLAEAKEPTSAMNLGSAFHTLVLEPKLFEREFCIKPTLEELPPAVFLRDVGKEQYEQIKSVRKEIQSRNNLLLEEFKIESENKIILSEDQFAKVGKMVDLVRKHEIVTTVLDGAVFEQSIFWTDPDTGIQFKTRPDIWSQKMVVDIKTTTDANPYTFSRSALNYGYYLQAGMAYEACKAIGKPIEMFVILACEKEPPHVPAVFIMKDEALQFGIDQFMNFKNLLKECFDKNTWPGYPVQELAVPKYAMINEEEQLA